MQSLAKSFQLKLTLTLIVCPGPTESHLIPVVQWVAQMIWGWLKKLPPNRVVYIP